MMIPFEVVLLGTEPNEFNRVGSKKRTLRDFFRNHHGRESSPQEIRIDGRKVLGSRKTVDPGDGKGPMNSASSRSHILKVLVFLLVFPIPAAGEVITRLPTREPRIALTFDACEMGQPHYLDAAVLDTLLSEQIPFTLFVSGKFARRNREELRRIAARDFVEVENHSLSHHHHMERLAPGRVREEVLVAGQLIEEITGKKPQFFRFPAGNYDAKTLRTVEDLGYRVVHWTFASGDPDIHLTPERLTRRVLSRSTNGSILIFHINGRGYATGRALPQILDGLRSRGYRFVTLKEALDPHGNRSTPPGAGAFSPTAGEVP